MNRNFSDRARTLTYLALWLATLALSTSGAARGQGLVPLKTSDFVTDRAGVLTDTQRAQLTQLCRSLKAQSGYELGIITLDTLNGEDPNHAATRFINENAAGQKGKDTGIVMMLVIRDHQFYIGTGSGTEAVIPDSVAGRISRDVVRPYLRQGRYGDALIAGAERIAEILRGSDDAAPWPGGTAPQPAAPEPMPMPSGGGGSSFGGVVLFMLFGIGVLSLLARAVRSAQRCPRCGAHMESTSQTLREPTLFRNGYGILSRTCPNCGYHDERRYTIPRRGGFYGGGMGGFGGGFGGSSGGWGSFGGGGGSFGGGGGGFSGGGGGFGGGGGTSGGGGAGTSW